MNSFDVVGFGALNVDRLFKVNKIANAEEESFVEEQSVVFGGSAANTIVGLARLGCKVGFIGRVGNDKEGSLLIEDLRKEKVDIKGITRSEERSGSVMGFVDRKGSRALYIDSGSNDTIDFEDIPDNYVNQSKFVHLTSFVGEKSFQSQKDLLRNLPGKVKVSFDPGALYASKGFNQLESIICRTYVLMPNLFELREITGKKDYITGSEYLLGRGVRVVAVKLGEKGCYVTDGNEKHLVEAFAVNVVDTTGAGDAFCAGFLYGLLNNKSLLECGRIGNFVASRCVTELGARTSLPHLRELRLS